MRPLYHTTGFGELSDILRRLRLEPGKGGYVSLSELPLATGDINARNLVLVLDRKAMLSRFERVDYSPSWYEKNPDKAAYIAGDGWREQFTLPDYEEYDNYDPDDPDWEPDPEDDESFYAEAELAAFMDKSGEREWISKREGENVPIKGAVRRIGVFNPTDVSRVKSTLRTLRLDIPVVVIRGLKEVITSMDVPVLRGINEDAPPGFSGTVARMKAYMPDRKAYALAWAMYKKGAKPRYKPEDGKPAYVKPETWRKKRKTDEGGEGTHPIPARVQKAAKQGLALRAEHGRGGTPVGLRTARILAKGGNIPLEGRHGVRHISQYFPRHEVDKRAPGFRPHTEGYPSNGLIAWLLWGGDAGRDWATNIASRTDEGALNENVPGVLTFPRFKQHVLKYLNAAYAARKAANAAIADYRKHKQDAGPGVNTEGPKYKDALRKKKAADTQEKRLADVMQKLIGYPQTFAGVDPTDKTDARYLNRVLAVEYETYVTKSWEGSRGAQQAALHRRINQARELPLTDAGFMVGSFIAVSDTSFGYKTVGEITRRVKASLTVREAGSRKETVYQLAKEKARLIDAAAFRQAEALAKEWDRYKTLLQNVSEVVSESAADREMVLESVSGVYYHGSPRKFTRFTLDRMERTTGGGPGLYFSEDADDAKSYGSGGYLYTVQINLRRVIPVVGRPNVNMVARLIREAPDWQFRLADWLGEESKNPIPDSVKVAGNIARVSANPYDAFLEVLSSFFGHERGRDYLRALVKLGYDGVKYSQRGRVNHLVVFDPSRITIQKVEPNKGD